QTLMHSVKRPSTHLTLIARFMAFTMLTKLLRSSLKIQEAGSCSLGHTAVVKHTWQLQSPIKPWRMELLCSSRQYQTFSTTYELPLRQTPPRSMTNFSPRCARQNYSSSMTWEHTRVHPGQMKSSSN